MTENFLDKVYATGASDDLTALFDTWASSYEAEVSGQGYATPGRCAAALASITTDLTAPVLDFGCGTGLSGLALRLAGFTTIDGLDLSAEMLAKAEAKGVYRSTRQVTADTPLEQGAYASIAAIGAIGAGAAPISMLDTLMHALPRGGRLVFSFNDHTLEDPMSTARINEWTDCGAARLLFCERGDHLPGLKMNSIVYILEKA